MWEGARIFRRLTKGDPVDRTELEGALSLVAEVGASLNAVTTTTDQRARRLMPRPQGRLKDVTLAVKDVIDLSGYATTMGSTVHSPTVRSNTASAVVVLEDAGAMTVAKTNCQEYSYGILGDESAFGRTFNPRDSDRITAGSSSGSAALVAAGGVELALGTDTAGSTRVPAAYCEIFGFKPTYDLIPLDGVFPLAPSFDTIGFLSESLGIIRRAFETCLGDAYLDEGDSVSANDAHIRIDTQFMSSEIQSGLLLNEIIDSEPSLNRSRSPILSDLLEDARSVFPLIRDFEATQIHHDQLRDRAYDYQPGVRAKLRRGLHIEESDYLSAVARLADLRRQSDRLWDHIDVVITPSFAGPELKWDTLDPIEAAERSVRFSQPVSVMGCPAISVPLGPGALNSVQLFSRPGTDLNLLSLVERILRHLSR